MRNFKVIDHIIRKIRSFVIDYRVKKLINANDEFYRRCNFVCSHISRANNKFINCMIFRLDVKGHIVECMESDIAEEVVSFPTILLYFTEKELEELVDQQLVLRNNEG